MSTIKIGNIGFNSDSLKDITLTEAYEKFSHIRKDIVRQAHSEANPNTRKKSSKKPSGES